MSLLLRLDAVQRRVADYISHRIQNIENIPLSIGGVSVRHFNKIDVNDILLKDLAGDTLSSIKRLTVHFSPLHLLREEVRVNTVTLERPRVNITRERADTATNIQFLLDIFASSDSTPAAPLPHIKVGQFHIYDGSLSYNVLSEPAAQKGIFSAAHINISDVSANISLKRLNADTLSLYIRNLAGDEASGLHLRRIRGKIEASKSEARLKDFSIELPASRIELPLLEAHYSINDSTKRLEALKYHGLIDAPSIAGGDLGALLPQIATIEEASLNVPFSGSDKRISIEEATLSAADGGVNLEASLTADNSGTAPAYKVQIASCNISERGIKELGTLLGDTLTAQDIQKRAGNIAIKADLAMHGKRANGSATLSTGSGSVALNIKSDNKGVFHIESNAKDINLARITGDSRFGLCQIASTTSGFYTDSTNFRGETKSTISSLRFQEATFSPITIEGTFDPDRYRATLGSNDKNLSCTAIFTINRTDKNNPVYTINIDADSISPHNLGLTERLKDGNISFEFAAEASGRIPNNSLIKANLYNFKLQTPEKYWKIRHLHVTDNSLDVQRKLLIDSDIISGYIMGYYTYSSLGNNIVEIIDKHIPALGIGKGHKKSDDNFVFDIRVNNSEIVSHLFDLPFCIKSASSISGSIDEPHNHSQISATFNNTTLLGSKYREINFSATSGEDKLSHNTQLLRPLKAKEWDNNENDIRITVKGDILADTLLTNIEWSNKRTPVNRGRLSLDVALGQTVNGSTSIDARLHPGIIVYNDSVWSVSNSRISGAGERFKIDNFVIRNNKRRLSINGVVGNSESDSLKIVLNKMELEELFDIANFHPVDFGGKASGTVNVARIFASPSFATNLEIEDFTFEKGRMGWMSFDGSWDEENKAILLNGRIFDGTHAHSTARGFVSPANDTLDISVNTDGARIEFLNHMLGSFLDNVDGRVKGRLHIRGRMKDVNLYGDLCPTGSMRLKPTNTTYYLKGDTVRLTRNRIAFDDVRFADKHGNQGLLNGAVSHSSLKRFGCDFDIKAHNLLAYDEDKFGENGFYGTAFVTGDARFIANSDGISLSAEIETNNNSKFVYNAAGPIGATDNKFVTFTDRRTTRGTLLDGQSSLNTEPVNDILSRLRLDFMISATPGMQLRVYTNTITDDYIDIYGSGPINAVYDEKEGFSMKGSLSLTRGTYKFTMQDIFPKEFAIQPGSTLGFNGDPFLANLNLKTIYTVPSAPLTDLSITAERRKNVKVNCLMDITGTLQSPNLTFGLELPDGNEEERELLASATSTPEQTNMQFIYLIGIGKFYTYDYNNQANNSQSSTMMESLISSTISGQLNNMLSQITDNDNWNFSGNFTTSERGWNSMEVEGMLSGRLLDNRLLINGNFGYRDNPLANKNFIGDFEVEWLLNKNGNISLKAYNKTNDRYFSKTTLTTQGAGIMLRHDFNNWLRLRKKKEKKTKE